MDDYPRLRDRENLWFGFLEGFHIPFQGERHPFKAPNLPLVRVMENVVMQKIDKECSEGRVLDPFSKPPVPNLELWELSPRRKLVIFILFTTCHIRMGSR